jgi:hypothetical protein
VKPTEQILKDMVKELPFECYNYVFVLNTKTLPEIGDTFHGYTVRRFKAIEQDKVYLMPDPVM